MKYLLVFILFPFIGFSQSEINDPEATIILDRISQSIDKNDQLKLLFDLIIKNPELEAETQEGFLYQDMDKFYVDIAQQIIINNSKEVYLIFKDDNTGQINSVSENTEGIDIFNPKSFMKIYKTDEYIYGITGEEDYDGKRLLSIEFKPKDRYSEYSKIRLAVDEQKDRPYYIKFFNKDGTRITLVLKEFITNPKIEAGQFEFTKEKFPNIQLEDLRID